MITIVMAYYNNSGMLERHLDEWSRYPKGTYKAILVDDGSPRTPAIDVLQGMRMEEFPVEIELYRILQDKPWNQNGARNLGMTHSSDFCLLTDMDHLLSVEDADRLTKAHDEQRAFQRKYAYKPLRKLAIGNTPYKRHPNTYLMHHELYWKVGGYDEDFCGYYGTDATFRRVLDNKIVETDLFALTLFGREVIPDASTVDYGRKGTEYHVSNSERLRKKRKYGGDPIPPLNFEWKKLDLSS